MHNNPWPLKVHALFGGMILLVLGIYCYPALRTSAVTHSRILPPTFAPDVSLYLNISHAQPDGAGRVMDPYYGIDVPVARMGYLKFGVGFRLFRGWNSLLRGSLWWSMLFWNVLWWASLCIIAIWFFRRFLPDNSPLLVLTALAFLMLFNFGVLKTQMMAWIDLPALRGFEDVHLAFIRPFFPQIPVPLVILYLGLQIVALQTQKWIAWAAMGTIQFLAFTIFPYAMLVMAGITFVATLGQLISKKHPVRWISLVLYAAACGFADLAFFMHGNGIVRSGGPVQQPLVHLQLSVLPHRIGGMWLVLAALSMAVLFIRDLDEKIKWPIFGFGVSILLLLTGDVFFSETALQVSTHGAYFVQPAAAILFVFVLSAVFRPLRETRTGRSVLFSIVGLLIVNGALTTRAAYLYSLPYNLEQSALASVVASASPTQKDLIIAHSLSVDDDCAWVPLVSNSHVLFCRNAQVLLSPEQNQHVQRFRQALYLYFTNRDHQWVERVIDDPGNVELFRLTFLGQVTTDVEVRRQNVDAVRKELIPPLLRIEDRDPEVSSFFRQYRRILVVDNCARPYFAGSRLSQYLKIEKQKISGDLIVIECSPLQQNELHPAGFSIPN